MTAGMPASAALNHALTTISTGGYAISDASFGNTSTLIQWVAIVFMLAGAIPFSLYPLLRHRLRGSAAMDAQLKGLLVVIIGTGLLLTLDHATNAEEGFFQGFTAAFFNLVSVVTTTGYASEDYSTWGNFSVAIFFCATFIGGCFGSTSGGIKIFRFQLLFALLKDQIARTIHPRISISSKYNGKHVSSEVITALVAYFCLFLISTLVLTLGLAATDLDIVTSFTGASTALMNVGPGLGDIIGPAGNFSELGGVAKLLLCTGMLLGRLEFLTLILLLSPSFWRG